MVGRASDVVGPNASDGDNRDGTADSGGVQGGLMPMPASGELDPAESALSLFAVELRRLRAASGLRQKDVARRLCCAPSAVGMVETARRVPSLGFAQGCDRLLGGGGVLVRLWPLVNRQGYPQHHPPVHEVEEAAAAISSYQPHIIDPLVRTPGYARAVAGFGGGDDVRGPHRDIFTGVGARYVSVLLDAAVFHRTVGDAEVMREQLARLLELSRHPRVTVRVLPLNAPVHNVLHGPLRLISLPDGTDLAHTPTYHRDALHTDPITVLACRALFDRAAAEALTPETTRYYLAARLRRTGQRAAVSGRARRERSQNAETAPVDGACLKDGDAVNAGVRP